MASSPRRIGEILLWSSMSNVVLLGCIAVGWKFDDIENRVRYWLYPGETAVVRQADPLAYSRLQRSDNEALTKGPQRHLKEALQITIMAVEAAGRPAEPLEPEDGPESAPVAFQYGPEDTGRSISPILRKDPTSGQLEIGSFKSVVLTGDAGECLDTGYAMLGDVGTSNDVLQVLASTDAMTMAKICAKNGTVIISCRNDQITISPRRSRPDQPCNS